MADTLTKPLAVVTDEDRAAVKDIVTRLDIPWWLLPKYMEAFAEVHAMGRTGICNQRID